MQISDTIIACYRVYPEKNQPLRPFEKEIFSYSMNTSTRTSRYGDITIRYPRYNRDTEGGKTFLVTTAKLWNSLPIKIRSSTSIKAFKQNYCNFIKEGYADLDSFPIS